VQDVYAPDVDADLDRLESGLRQLKIQYDMFFAGSLPKQPYELRAQLERLIKRYSNAPIRKYATRFHFNALVSRYNSLSELWSKTLRTMEEGDRPAPALLDRARNGERTLAVCRVTDPRSEHETLRQLHARYLEARKKSGERGGRLTFEAFVQGISSQAEQLRKKAGCEKVELRLVVADRKVHLKARPGR